ncbi:MAG TPA: NAD(P)H-dependent oxidoreductase subunit E, partial [Vicinamibacteria bacterium]
MNLRALEPKAREILQRYDQPRAATLPILWLVQESFGYISPEAERWVGDLVGTTVAHVREVVSFYTMYRTAPAGRRELRVCTSLPCLLKGAGDVLSRIEERLKVRPGETTVDGELTLTEVECLCACEIAPMAQLDEQFVGPLDDGTLERVLRGETREPEPYVATDGPILSTRFKDPEGTWFDAYVKDGGYTAAKKALSMTPAAIIEEVGKS